MGELGISLSPGLLVATIWLWWHIAGRSSGPSVCPVEVVVMVDMMVVHIHHLLASLLQLLLPRLSAFCPRHSPGLGPPRSSWRPRQLYPLMPRNRKRRSSCRQRAVIPILLSPFYTLMLAILVLQVCTAPCLFYDAGCSNLPTLITFSVGRLLLVLPSPPLLFSLSILNISFLLLRARMIATTRTIPTDVLGGWHGLPLRQWRRLREGLGLLLILLLEKSREAVAMQGRIA